MEWLSNYQLNLAEVLGKPRVTILGLGNSQSLDLSMGLVFRPNIWDLLLEFEILCNNLMLDQIIKHLVIVNPTGSLFFRIGGGWWGFTGCNAIS